MKSLFFFITVLLFVSFSCEKENIEGSNNKESQLTEQQLKVREKLQKTALILTEMSSNSKVVASIKDKILNTSYEDENVLFKDLFSYNEDKSVCLFDFKEEFLNSAQKINSLKSQSIQGQDFEFTDINDLIDYLCKNDIQVYWPYIPITSNDKNITISFHPIDNDSVGIGYKYIPNIDGNGFSYEEVIVDDEYALNNAVWIVNIYDRPDSTLTYDNYLKSMKSVTTGPHFEIRVGKAKCYQHYDGLFGGGSEIFFGIVTGAINLTNGQVTAVPKGFMKSFSRTSINLGYHIDVNTMFLADWTTDLTQVSIFIYEDDPEGTREASGSVKSTTSAKITGNVTGGTSTPSGTTPPISTTTENAGLSGELGGSFEYSATWKATVKSQDAIIMHQDFPRDWFLETNDDENAEWGKWSDEYQVIYRGVKDEFAFCLPVIERTY